MSNNFYEKMWREAQEKHAREKDGQERRGNADEIGEASECRSEPPPNNADSHISEMTDKSGVVELPIECLIPYPNQPFKPYNDEQLEPLAESIEKYGIIEPLIVRKTEEKYQIISGHNRANAAKRIGLERIPAVVRELDDNQADIVMVETNLRSRAKILPSEKAFALKLKYEAMKHQGKRTDLLPDKFDQKLRTSEIIAKDTDESEKQIRRYIAITKLNRNFLDLLDAGKLPFVAAVNLSSICGEIQDLVYNFFFVENQTGIDLKTSEILKELGDEITEQILKEQFLNKPEKAKRLTNIKIRFKKIKEYFPKETTEKEVEETILKALEKYFKKEEV